VPYLTKMRKHDLDLQSVEQTPDSIGQYDCVVVATDHDRFDWNMIREHARLIVDTRGIYEAEDEKVFRA
jgi:UDP-N-acetyl-D-glucosamine dehydrogenase